MSASSAIRENQSESSVTSDGAVPPPFARPNPRVAATASMTTKSSESTAACVTSNVTLSSSNDADNFAATSALMPSNSSGATTTDMSSNYAATSLMLSRSLRSTVVDVTSDVGGNFANATSTMASKSFDSTTVGVTSNVDSLSSYEGGNVDNAIPTLMASKSSMFTAVGVTSSHDGDNFDNAFKPWLGVNQGGIIASWSTWSTWSQCTPTCSAGPAYRARIVASTPTMTRYATSKSPGKEHSCEGFGNSHELVMSQCLH